MVGLYGRETFYDEAYVSAAIGYGWHDVTTARIVTVSGTDLLSGKFNAKEFGGRVEAGFRFALDEQLGLTPFVAFAGESFHTPAYTETAVSGSTNFALSYAANDTLTSHTELGGKLGRDFSISGGTLSLEGLLGWAHQFSDATSAQAGFVTLPGSGFVLLGVKPAADAAMLGLDLQVHDGTGFVYGARVQSQIGPGTSSITGTLNLAYHW